MASKKTDFVQFRPTEQTQRLYDRLTKLYYAAHNNQLPLGNANSKQRAKWREGRAAARAELSDLVNEAISKYRHVDAVTMDQLVELAVLGSFSAAADRLLGYLMRRAAGVPDVGWWIAPHLSPRHWEKTGSTL
jgi:hypothetical protein